MKLLYFPNNPIPSTNETYPNSIIRGDMFLPDIQLEPTMNVFAVLSG